MNYKTVADLENLKIATSYSRLLKNFLTSKKVNAEIHEISGSVELAPGIGLADAVCDLVSSGSTLFMNGLREVQTILKSQAVLVRNKNLDEAQQKVLDQIVFRIRAVHKAQNDKYVLLNAPNS